MQDVRNRNQRAGGKGRLRHVSRKIVGALFDWRNSDGLGFTQHPLLAPSAIEARDGRARRQADGMATLDVVAGGAGRELLERLDQLSPDISRLLIEDTYGAIISRPNLSLKTRELATVAALVALGDVPWALRIHCSGMLNTGWCAREMAETMLLAAAGGGAQPFDAAAAIARGVLDEREHNNAPVQKAESAARRIPDDLQRLARALCDGAMHSAIVLALTGLRAWDGRPLVEKDKRMVELARTLARGEAQREIGLRLERCLAEGWTRDELTELLIHMTAYVGWPPVLNALKPFNDAFQRLACKA